LYDESIGIELKKSSLLPFKNYFTRSPFINIFRIFDKHEFVFVNIHLKARRLDENENERTKDEALSLSILAEAMSDTVGKISTFCVIIKERKSSGFFLFFLKNDLFLFFLD